MESLRRRPRSFTKSGKNFAWHPVPDNGSCDVVWELFTSNHFIATGYARLLWSPVVATKYRIQLTCTGFRWNRLSQGTFSMQNVALDPTPCTLSRKLRPNLEIGPCLIVRNVWDCVTRAKTTLPWLMRPRYPRKRFLIMPSELFSDFQRCTALADLGKREEQLFSPTMG